MTNEELIKAKAMICNKYMSADGVCGGCPFSYEIQCIDFQKAHPKESVKIIEEWWTKNKPKTNAEWVAEQLEKIGYQVDIQGLRNTCPVPKSKFYKSEMCKVSLHRGLVEDNACNACRLWWEEEHKDE